mmetsp:Transcript_30065/g.76190  ORF Transcript_30065/g.76190 Transcript_30065/m.76190 type:complete len:241 (+) Transcript_30065:273-995(+)
MARDRRTPSPLRRAGRAWSGRSPPSSGAGRTGRINGTTTRSTACCLDLSQKGTPRAPRSSRRPLQPSPRCPRGPRRRSGTGRLRRARARQWPGPQPRSCAFSVLHGASFGRERPRRKRRRRSGCSPPPRAPVRQGPRVPPTGRRRAPARSQGPTTPSKSPASSRARPLTKRSTPRASTPRSTRCWERRWRAWRSRLGPRRKRRRTSTWLVGRIGNGQGSSTSAGRRSCGDQWGIPEAQSS